MWPFKNYSQKKNLGKIAIITGVAIMLYALLGMSWPLLLASLVIAVLTLRIPKALEEIATLRVFTILILLLIVLQLESVLFWALKIGASPDMYSILTLVVVLIAVGIQYKKEGRIFTEQKLRLTRKDLLIALPAIIITTLFWVRTVAPANSTEVAVVKSLTYGMDDASHMGIMGDLLRSNGNLLSRPEYTAIMTNPNHASYPMGWHVSTAMTAASFTDYKDKPVLTQTWTYFFAKLFTLFTSVFALTALTYIMALRSKLALQSIIPQLAFIISTLFASTILLLPLYFEGFFSFLPVLTFLMLFSCIILSSDKKDETTQDIIMGLLVAGSALSWVLTAPMLLLAMAGKRVYDKGTLKKLPPSFYVSFLIGLGAFLAQAYIMLRANSNVAQNITSPGGITNPTHFLVIICLGIFVYMYLKEKHDTFSKNLSFVVLPFALALVALLFFLALKSPEITYYYFKIQAALLVVIMPLALILLAKVTMKNSSDLLDRIISLGIFVALLGLSIPSVIGYEYTHNVLNRAQGSVLSNNDSERIINQSLDRHYDSQNARVLFLYPEQNARTILSSSIARKSYPAQKCDHILFQDAYINNVLKFSDSVEKCVSSLPPVVIYTNSKGISEIEKSLDKNLLKTGEVVIRVTE